jgi:hypothetical protein
MTIAIEILGPSALELDILDKLNADDYREFIPPAEARIERQSKVNLLVRIKNFHGWTPSALWEDLKFDVKHFNDVGRLAVVGEDDSGKWMTTVSRPFTGAEVEFFTKQQLDAARDWVRQSATPNRNEPL